MAKETGEAELPLQYSDEGREMARKATEATARLAAEAAARGATMEALSAASMRLMRKQPFFSALMMMASISLSDAVPTAATDGLKVWCNPAFMDRLSAAEREGVLLHEVLHMALLHLPRRGSRDPLVWNIAADISVNGMVKAIGMSLPEGLCENKDLEARPVEEIYELLLKDPKTPRALSISDLLGEGLPGDADGDGDRAGRMARAAERWSGAMARAQLATGARQGTLPAGMLRELGSLEPGQLDWRTLLWRRLVRTPVNYEGYDRRFIGRGLYLDNLEGDGVRVAVCVDTSGSIDDRALSAFLAELRGIMGSYPHVRADLYYCDAAIVGPFELGPGDDIPRPEGGGGTSFVPFFEATAADTGDPPYGALVYLTDGYGTFPEGAPGTETIWVVTPGGLEPADFPFGEVALLL